MTNYAGRSPNPDPRGKGVGSFIENETRKDKNWADKKRRLKRAQRKAKP